MQEYDLAVFAILWGTAIAFALAAITMIDSDRRKLLIALWMIAVAFFVTAMAWPWIAGPNLKIGIENVTAIKIILDLVGATIFSLLALDFGLRSGWFVKLGLQPPPRLSEALETIDKFTRQVDELKSHSLQYRGWLLPMTTAPFDPPLMM